MATDDYVAKWRYEQLRAENERLREALARHPRHWSATDENVSKPDCEACRALAAAEGATDG